MSPMHPTNSTRQTDSNQQPLPQKVPIKIPMNETNANNHDRKKYSTFISVIRFPWYPKVNAKPITPKSLPVQIDTKEKSHPVNPNFKNGLLLCPHHFPNQEKSGKIFYTTKNPWPKIWAKNFNRKKITKKIFPKKSSDKKIRPNFSKQKNDKPQNFSQKSEAKFSIKIFKHSKIKPQKNQRKFQETKKTGDKKSNMKKMKRQIILP